MTGDETDDSPVTVDEGEEIEVIIQDDLTGLDHFHIIAQGHIVEHN